MASYDLCLRSLCYAAVRQHFRAVLDELDRVVLPTREPDGRSRLWPPEPGSYLDRLQQVRVACRNELRARHVRIMQAAEEGDAR